MTTDAAQAPLLFNPFDPAFRANPYPVYRRLREEEPVHHSPFEMTVLSRYADIVQILRDPQSSSDSTKSDQFIEDALRQGLNPDDLRAQNRRPFLFMDPPDHTRLRGLVNKAFTPHVVEKLRPRVEVLVREMLDAVASRGEMDVIEDVAYPLPVTVICEMLGVPVADHEKFRDWSRAATRSLDPDIALPPDEIEKRERMFDQFAEYFSALIEKRRDEPRDDLLSALIAAEAEGSKLSTEELLSTCILLLIAGHETTVNLIGNGMLALLRHPEQLALLRDEPSVTKTAIEELLRYDPPVQLTGRLPLRDMTLSDGTVLPKGKQVVLLIGAANRDPAQFDEPERLDLRREENRHVAFGMGIHFCLGAPLARVEGQIALGEMARRLQSPQLAVAEPSYRENLTLRGLAALPVRFSGLKA